MKKQTKKRTGLWAAVAAGVVVVCVAVALFFLSYSPAGEVEQPQTEPAQAQQYSVYWNVDRLLYLDAETGLNNRMADGSGYYPITLSVDGEQKQFKVVDKPLIAKMDKMDLFGIVQDENGIITDILEVEEFTGGMVAERFYISEVTENGFTANSSKTLKGESASFSLENARVYSVVGEGFLVGMPTQLRVKDRIIGIVDQNGILTHVYVVETAGPTRTMYCDHCEMEVEWTGWNKEEEAPSSTGHYYLMNDVQLKRQLSIPAEQAIVLDLNGHKVTGAEGRRVFSLHNEGVYLGIMDYSREQTGKVEAWGQGAHAQGGCVWVRYGIFELFSGTLDASRMRNDLYGLALCVNKETTANIYDGTIIGGTSVVYTNPQNGKKMGAMAGTVYCEGALNIYGGVIRNGTAEGYIDSTDGTYKRGFAGNVYVGANGVLTMTGGSIIDGTADGDGGNLYISGIAKISGDARIAGGTSRQSGKRGGNILVASAGTLIMTGGRIADGTSGGSGGNLYSSGVAELTNTEVTGGNSTNTEINNISAYKGTFLLKDCTVNGDVYVTKDCTLTLAGATKIEKGENYGLKVVKDAMIVPGELSQGAAIAVTATGYFSQQTNTAVAGYFTLSCEGSVFGANGRLFAGKSYCLCGSYGNHAGYCNGKALLWQAWTDSKKMPDATGNYYLTSNVYLSKRATVGKAGGTAAEARQIAWDLNGYTVTGAAGSRVAFVTGFSTLSVCDTRGGGKLQAVSTYNENGHTVFGGSNTVINLYGGTVTGGNVQAVLKNATAQDGTEIVKAQNGQGGNIYTYGVLNMYGGTIADGVAKAVYNEAEDKYSNGQGGNVAISSDGQFNFYGGTITGGTADLGGGNLYTAAPVNMYGGTITGGSLAMESKSGGNVYLTGTCTFQMEGGEITNGIATSNGGNVMSYGQFQLVGGAIIGGQASNLGGNLCVGSSGGATVSGGSISGGIAKSGTDADGQPIVDDQAVSANIIAMKDSTFAVTGGQIGAGVRVLNGCALTLGGAPVLEGLCLAGDVVATIEGTFADTASIQLTRDSNGFFAVTQDPANGGVFAVSEGLLVTFDETEGMLRIIPEPEESDHKHCLCAGLEGHTCQEVGFLPWGDDEEEKNSLPTSGSYYLVENIVLADPGSGSGICKVTETLDLCLNGFTVTTQADCARRMLHVSGGSLNITDCSEAKTGAITAGYATYTAEGGLILVGSDSTLNLYAGTLTGTDVSAAEKNGGTLRIYGTVNMYGGTVTGGKAVNGGNIALSGTLNLFGGTVTGGTATGNGGGIWANGVMTVSGNVQVSGNTASNLYVPASKQLAVEGTLDENAMLYVTATDAFALTEVADNALHFRADDGVSQIVFENNALVLVTQSTPEPQGHTHCICGGNDKHTGCEDVTWTAISGEVETLDSGYYYVDGTVNLKGSITVGSGKDIYICLNNGTITAKDGQRAFLINGGGQLHIADCGGNGKLTGNAATATANLNGGVIFVMKGTLELFGGTVESQNTDADKTQNGGVIRVGNTAANAGAFRMYGGTVTGGTAQKGGNIYVRSGSFEMLGGTVTGGIATINGDNLFIQNSADATVTISGGCVHGGVYQDGTAASFTVSGDGSITAPEEEEEENAG